MEALTATTPAQTVDVAVIIPVLDDAPALQSLFERMSDWTARPSQIIVVAAGDDATVRTVAAAHASLVLEASANRGAQLDQGARAAKAATLWFLHADAEPDPAALEAIAAARYAGRESGCFRFAFQGEASVMKTLIASLTNCRVRLGGMAYGDQGLFASREAYADCGGFAQQPLFEEVRLVRALRKRGGFAVLPQALRVSPRRWERDGWWARSLHNRWLALCHLLGIPAAGLASNYHRDSSSAARTR